MSENTTPSEGVKGRFTAKMALEEVSCAQGHFGGAMAIVTAAIVVMVVVAMMVVTVVTAVTVVTVVTAATVVAAVAAAVVTICDFIPEFHTKALLP